MESRTRNHKRGEEKQETERTEKVGKIVNDSTMEKQWLGISFLMNHMSGKNQKFSNLLGSLATESVSEDKGAER